MFLLVGVVPLPAADTGASERRIPPPGIHIPDADRRELEAGADSLARQIESLRGDARVKRDEAITEKDIAGNNLVLWGDPRSNKVLSKIADRLPINWDATVVRVGKRTFDSRHHLAVLIFPNPLNPTRYVILNSGFTFAHPRSTSNADQTPKLPDYAVVDIEGPPSVGAAGEVVAAGFFDERWRLVSEAAPQTIQRF